VVVYADTLRTKISRYSNIEETRNGKKESKSFLEKELIPTNPYATIKLPKALSGRGE
jgi:hypothetical protein